MSDKTREQMDLSKLKELASKAIAGRGKSSFVEVPAMRRFNVAIEPEDVLALIEVAEKAQALLAATDARDGPGVLLNVTALRSALSRIAAAGLGEGGQG